MRRRYLWFTVLLLGGFLLTAVMILPAQALLMVCSPQDMLLRADNIVVGTITKLVDEDHQQTARIELEKELKGTLEEDVITVEAGGHIPLVGASDVFPDKGTRVFLVLEEDDDGYQLASGMNAVALVKNGHVTSLYNGYNVGINGRQWTISDYVEAFDDYYHNQDESSSETNSHQSTIVNNGSGVYVHIQGQGGRVTVRINGREINSEVSPIIVHNRTVVPLRQVAEEMGLKVVWHDEDGTVTLSGEDENGDPFEITLKIGSGQVSGHYSERIRQMAEDILGEACPMIIDGHTMVPLRFLSDVISAPLEWNENTGTVSITRRIHSSFNQNSFNNYFNFNDEEPGSVLNEDDDNQTIDLEVGETIALRLESNVSTGYTWVVHKQPDQDIVKFSGGSWMPNISKPSMLGSSGYQSWHIKAVDQGETTLKLWYCRPWESRDPESTFSVTFIVR